MTGRLDRSNRYIGSAAALLLGLSCSTAIASNDIKSDCHEINNSPQAFEVPAPSLTIRLVDRGLTESESDMKAPAADPAGEKVTSPALAADTTDTAVSDDEDTGTTDTDTAAAADDLPDTALRLPGVSEKELPRFRRQMYRTDI